MVKVKLSKYLLIIKSRAEAYSAELMILYHRGGYRISERGGGGGGGGGCPGNC